MKCENMEIHVFNKRVAFVKLLILIFCLLAAILVVSSLCMMMSRSPPASSSANTRRLDNEFYKNMLQKSIKEFTSKLYKEISQEDGNILFSPSSLHICTALVQMGAEGNTLQEMAQVLSLPTENETVLMAFQQTLPILKASRKNTLNIANRVFVKKNFDLSQNFLKMAIKSFDAGVEAKDFSNPTQSANEINEWVKEKTKDKISEIIKPEMIDGLTRMILINALYFKGEWQTQFDSEITRPKAFYLNESYQLNADTMYTVGEFGYHDHKELRAKFLDMPYLDNEFKMTIVLPYDIEGLPQLESQIDQVLDHQQMKIYNQVTVLMPKFRIESSTSMTPVLRKLGMNSAFDRDELTGFSASGDRLHISDVLQKTFIDVNEKGTEAGAVTAEILADRSFGITFNVNHPFLFILRHNSTGIVHFIGRFIGPALLM